ncbi:hypothetical protein ABZ801_41475 [Actinomadura sp. NPDC047616]
MAERTVTITYKNGQTKVKKVSEEEARRIEREFERDPNILIVSVT